MYVSPLFSTISSGWGMRTALLCNDSEWWGRCFLCFSKVLDRRIPFVVLGFPVAWYAFPFAFRWFWMARCVCALCFSKLFRWSATFVLQGFSMATRLISLRFKGVPLLISLFFKGCPSGFLAFLRGCPSYFFKESLNSKGGNIPISATPENKEEPHPPPFAFQGVPFSFP